MLQVKLGAPCICMKGEDDDNGDHNYGDYG